jgi:hypothetical protein
MIENGNNRSDEVIIEATIIEKGTQSYDNSRTNYSSENTIFQHSPKSSSSCASCWSVYCYSWSLHIARWGCTTSPTYKKKHKLRLMFVHPPYPATGGLSLNICKLLINRLYPLPLPPLPAPPAPWPLGGIATPPSRFKVVLTVVVHGDIVKLEAMVASGLMVKLRRARSTLAPAPPPHSHSHP